MTLHFLASYSTAQLMMLFGGLGILLSSVTMLVRGLTEEDNELLPASYAGLACGICWTAANLLRHSPRLEGLMVSLSLIGAATSICYTAFIMRHNRKRRAGKSLPEPAVSSDKTWPPPPSSHGG